MSRAAETLLALRQATDRTWSSLLPGEGLAARLDSLGREAAASFEAQGIPTRRLESWKGTNFARLEEMEFVQLGADDAAAPSAQDLPLADTDADSDAKDADLVFVDGRLRPASASRAQLPKGIRVLSLAEAANEAPEILENRLALLPDLKKEPLAALQTACFQDVAVVILDAGSRADRPIRIRSFASSQGTSKAGSAQPNADFPRLLLVAERDSAATVLFESGCEETSVGLTAFVAEYHLAEGARIEAIQIQSESAPRIHFTSAHARLEAGAHFDSHVFSLGTGLVRSELAIGLKGPGAEAKLRAFFLGREKGHIDHFTTVDHVAPHCTSDQEYRGVLGDASKGVFRGRVLVQPGAEKTDARQSNPNLLLSGKAAIDTKPQLEIYADDIRASHGSTIGQIDPDALFFLRARGIEESDARLLLTRGFAQRIVDGIEHEELREIVSTRVEGALSQLEPAAGGSRNGGAA